MQKFYTMTVNGEEYKMRLTAGAIMQIEKKLGKPLFKALETNSGQYGGNHYHDPLGRHAAA